MFPPVSYSGSIYEQGGFTGYPSVTLGQVQPPPPAPLNTAPTVGTAPLGTPNPAQPPAGSTMPTGIDPRLSQLYQEYGVTPGGRGSGLEDWQYWQNDALNNAHGDWNYILGRLKSDLSGSGPDAKSGGGTGTGGGGLGTFTPNIPTSKWSPDPRTDQLYQMLLGRAGESLNISPNDPIISGQVAAFEAADTRSQRNYLADLAESEGPNANIGMEKRMTSEKIGQDTAGFQAELMGRELTARRQEIQQSLSQMGQFLSEQERLDLQNQLAIMDNLLGQAGLQQGAYQFDQNNQFRNSPMMF